MVDSVRMGREGICCAKKPSGVMAHGVDSDERAAGAGAGAWLVHSGGRVGAGGDAVELWTSGRGFN
jgi:hypothetical protein